MPKVSVVIPIYNVEKYLRQCLESVIHQTLRDIEIICVNDGSTDKCLSILNEYKAIDSRIKIIDKKNSGYGDSMNRGIDVATGDYLGIVEPDDFIKLNMYETLYKIAIKKDLDIIKADFYRFKGNGNSLQLDYNQLCPDTSYYNKILCPTEDQKTFFFIMNTWSGIYKRAFIEKYHIRHNTTPGAAYQDNGFWFQTFCLAKRVYFLNQPFYMNRRDNPNSSVFRKDKAYAMNREYDFIYDFLSQEPERKKKFISVYQVIKFNNYIFNLNRIADELKPEFLQSFADEFKEAEEKGELNRDVFTSYEWSTLRRIMNFKDKYYIYKDLKYKNALIKFINFRERYGLIPAILKAVQKVF
jgi:glycosyltransferase involved in cell wall biosynthesis